MSQVPVFSKSSNPFQAMLYSGFTTAEGYTPCRATFPSAVLHAWLLRMLLHACCVFMLSDELRKSLHTRNVYLFSTPCCFSLSEIASVWLFFTHTDTDTYRCLVYSMLACFKGHRCSVSTSPEINWSEQRAQNRWGGPMTQKRWGSLHAPE